MSYAEHLAGARRLDILKLLVADGGSSNESVVELGLTSLGHHAGVDRPYVRAQLRALEQAGAITLEFYRDVTMVARITERGVACASGRIRIDGVAAPPMGG